MKDFGEAEDPVVARLALVPIMFSFFKGFLKTCQPVFMKLQLETRG